jgi:hypothetical protein
MELQASQTVHSRLFQRNIILQICMYGTLVSGLICAQLTIGCAGSTGDLLDYPRSPLQSSTWAMLYHQEPNGNCGASVCSECEWVTTFSF